MWSVSVLVVVVVILVGWSISWMYWYVSVINIKCSALRSGVCGNRLHPGLTTCHSSYLVQVIVPHRDTVRWYAYFEVILPKTRRCRCQFLTRGWYISSSQVSPKVTTKDFTPSTVEMQIRSIEVMSHYFTVINVTYVGLLTNRVSESVKTVDSMCSNSSWIIS